MKMQLMTVDGRHTPIILPQIWDHEKEDWVVTSTENPLPTQVTGSSVEEVIMNRTISSPETGVLKRPSNAKIAVLELNVTKIVGDDEAPVRISTFNRIDGRAADSFALSSNYAHEGRHFHFWGIDGLDYDTAEKGSNILSYKSSKIPILNFLAFAIYIISGHEADVEVKVSWLL